MISLHHNIPMQTNYDCGVFVNMVKLLIIGKVSLSNAIVCTLLSSGQISHFLGYEYLCIIYRPYSK